MGAAEAAAAAAAAAGVGAAVVVAISSGSKDRLWTACMRFWSAKARSMANVW